MQEVTMPKLSDSMEVGRIIAWKVAEGDTVSAGDVLAEVESDKAVMDLECFDEGVVARIIHGDGEEVAVGDPIALIAEAGEAEGAPPTVTEEAGAAPEAPVAEEAPPEKEKEEAPEPAPETKTPPKPAPRKAALVKRAAPIEATGKRPAISPYAGKLALALGVDVTKVTGTGPGGRIIARDVEAAGKRTAGGIVEPPHVELAPSVDEELPPIEGSEEEADVEEASVRLKTQVRRVSASKHVIPHFYITRAVDVTALLEKKDALKQEYGATVTHLIMRACVLALEENPDANRSYDRGRIIRWKGINVGVAVDTDAGLTVPVLADAQKLGLRELVERTRDLVARAKENKLTAEQRRHATFTITNLGMFGVEEFEPIINPPSSITLAVASALPGPVVRGEAIYIGKVIRLTASCDHRIIEGATAARFMQTLSECLEDPDRLLT